MANYYRFEDFYFCSINTGPRHWRLGLLVDKSRESCGDPIIKIDPAIGSCHHGTIDENKVKESVTKSFNREQTGYVIISLRYPENDSTDPSGFSRCAQLIALKLKEESDWPVVSKLA